MITRWSRTALRASALGKRMGVALASCLFALLLLEAGFRLFYRDETVTLDLDPELYWRPRPGQKTRQVTINRQGLRGPETTEKNPSRSRLLATGDSFTYGERVSDEETWPSQLGALLDAEGARHAHDQHPFEVLNGGGPGWGVFQMERFLRRAIPRLSPDVVLLAITPIDVYRQPFRPGEWEAYAAKQRRRKQLRDTSVFLTYMARRLVRLELGHRAVPNEQEHETDRESLWTVDAARIRGLVEDFAGGPRFVLVVLQDFSEEHDWIAERGRTLADAIGIDFFDLGPAYVGASPRSLTVPGDGHPNGLGHARTARAIADMLYAHGVAMRPDGAVRPASEVRAR